MEHKDEGSSTMMSKKHDPFIDLKHKLMMETAPAENKKEEPRGPTLYISGPTELPFEDEDVGKTFIVEAKVIVRGHSFSKEADKISHSYDLEFTGIRIKE